MIRAFMSPIGIGPRERLFIDPGACGAEAGWEALRILESSERILHDDDPWYGGYVRIGARGPYRELLRRAEASLIESLQAFCALEAP